MSEGRQDGLHDFSCIGLGLGAFHRLCFDSARSPTVANQRLRFARSMIDCALAVAKGEHPVAASEYQNCPQAARSVCHLRRSPDRNLRAR